MLIEARATADAKARATARVAPTIDGCDERLSRIVGATLAVALANDALANDALANDALANGALANGALANDALANDALAR